MSPVNERIAAMTAAVTSGRPLHEVARERGLPLEDLEVWAALYGAATREAAKASRRRWQIGLSACAAIVGLVGGVAFAGTCASILPAPLVTMCQNEPALASEINGNFQTVRDWILAPPAAVTATSSISAATSITAGTSLSARTAIVTGGASQTQGLQLWWNTLLPGLGRAELINNRGLGGGGFEFYERSMVTDAPGGALLSMNRGRANFSGGVGGNGNLCFEHADCVDSGNFGCGQTGSCPQGTVAVGLTDGTGCGVWSRLRCCGLRLVPCP